MHLCSSYAKFFYFYEEFKNVQANTFPMSQLLISFDFQIKCSPMPHLFLHIFSILASQRLCLKESACLIIQSQVILKIEPNQKKKKNFNNIARNLDNISCYIFSYIIPFIPLLVIFAIHLYYFIFPCITLGQQLSILDTLVSSLLLSIFLFIIRPHSYLLEYSQPCLHGEGLRQDGSRIAYIL